MPTSEERFSESITKLTALSQAVLKGEAKDEKSEKANILKRLKKKFDELEDKDREIFLMQLEKKAEQLRILDSEKKRSEIFDRAARSEYRASDIREIISPPHIKRDQAQFNTSGIRRIKALDSMPISYLPDISTRKAKLIELELKNNINRTKAALDDLAEKGYTRNEDNIDKGSYSTLKTLDTLSSPARTIGYWSARGMLTKSKAKDDRFHKSWTNRRNQALVDHLLPIYDTIGTSTRLRLLRDHLGQIKRDRKLGFQERESDSYGDLALINEGELDKLIGSIDDELKSREGEKKKTLDSVDEAMKAADSGILAENQKLVDREDDIWKYRILQMILLISPLSPMAFLGMISPLAPLLHQIGSFLLGNTNFASFISSIFTPNVTGPFGFITDQLGLDDAAHWLLDNDPLSVVSDVVGLVVQNPIVTTASSLFAQTGILTGGSPLLLFAPGAYMLMCSGKTTEAMNLYDDRKKFEQAGEKKLSAHLNKLRTMLTEAAEKQKPDDKKIIGEHLKILKQEYLSIELVRFITSCHHDPDDKEMMNRIFAGIEIKGAALASSGDSSLSTVLMQKEILADQEMDPQLLVKFLADNPDFKKEACDRLLLFSYAATKHMPEQMSASELNEAISAEIETLLKPENQSRKDEVLAQQRTEMNDKFKDRICYDLEHLTAKVPQSNVHQPRYTPRILPTLGAAY